MIEGKQLAQDGAVVGDIIEWDGSRWKPVFLYAGDTAWFGDGSDGDVVISTTVTNTRDMFYNNLTIVSGGVLQTSNYRVFVKGTLTVQAGGRLENNGGSAPSDSATAGTTFGAGSVQGGRNGGAGGVNNGTGGTSAIGGSKGGVGGAGGAGGTGTGGAAGTAAAPGTTNGAFHYGMAAVNGAASGADNWSAVLGGAGGGGGGGDGVNSGGGGGAGAGVLIICAKDVVVQGSGRITNNGGAGSTRTTGNVGGGGGGGGGWFVLIRRTLSNSGIIEAAGGVGGAGAGTGVAGASGAAGTFLDLVTAGVAT